MKNNIKNYEKQHKECTCKVSGRSVVFLAFYADFCLCPKSVIITTLTYLFWFLSVEHRADQQWDKITEENKFYERVNI